MARRSRDESKGDHAYIVFMAAIDSADGRVHTRPSCRRAQTHALRDTLYLAGCEGGASRGSRGPHETESHGLNFDAVLVGCLLERWPANSGLF